MTTPTQMSKDALQSHGAQAQNCYRCGIATESPHQINSYRSMGSRMVSETLSPYTLQHTSPAVVSTSTYLPVRTAAKGTSSRAVGGSSLEPRDTPCLVSLEVQTWSQRRILPCLKVLPYYIFLHFCYSLLKSQSISPSPTSVFQKKIACLISQLTAKGEICLRINHTLSLIHI